MALARVVAASSRRARLLALTLGCLLVASVPVLADQASWQADLDGVGGRIVLSGVEVHRTSNAVQSLRTLAPQGTDLQLILWDEAGEPFYAVVEDGAPRGRARRTAYDVELANGQFDPLLGSGPALDESLRAAAGNRLYLVQLVATPLPALQERLRLHGATIHRHLTHHTMIVELDPAVRTTVGGLPWVRWVGAYHPGYRLEPFLRQALADGSLRAAEPARYSVMLVERGAARQRDLGAAIEAEGGTLEVTTDAGFRLEATMTADQLVALAHDDRVQYIDRWGGPLETDMDIVRDVGGADYIETVGGFTGTGVRGEVFDSELRTTHQEWATNAPIVHSSTSNGSPPHGTSASSNVFASGTNAAARGLAPDGQLIFFVAAEASQFGGSVSRYTIYEELLDPAGLYRAVFQTSSVGNARTFFYTTISAETDDALFQHQVLSTQSQSNAGNQDSRPQAWAKNIVSVGGFRHQGTADRSDDAWSFSASIGPSDDGRIKPDLSFFYDGIFAARNGSDTNYTEFGGTSSATPQTAGYFALLYDMWHQGVWPGFGGDTDVFDSRPQMMTAKALMIHNAHRYDWSLGGANSDLDRFKQGWGTADARNLYDNAPQTRIIDESVVRAPRATYTTTVTVSAGQEELKVTLAYLDPMGTPGAMVHRINDLSLRVTGPGGTVYWGNNGLTAGNVSVAAGDSNEIDTVENVFLTNPAAGEWTIEVIADEVVQDSHVETPEIDADFALIISPSGVLFADGFEAGDTSGWALTDP